MLQFLKKTGRKLSNSDDHNINANESQLNEENALLNAENYCLENVKENTQSRSRLSKNLLEILAEQSCICYFVQFLESKEALPLIKFWLDVESFKAAAGSCGKKNYDSSSEGICNKNRKRVLNRSVSSEGYDSLSYLSVDGDSISTNSFSESNLADVDEEIASKSNEELQDVDEGIPMRQSLTDDEKSQICEKKIKYDDIKDSKFNSIINSDAVRIYRKYLVTNSSHYIDIPATILSNISLALCGGNCNDIIFDDAQQHIVEILETNYLNQFLDSTFYCKYTIDVLTSDSLTLSDILYSETALFYFMEYLEQDGKRLFLEFWMSAINFKKTFEQNQAQSDALILYEKYFSLQATCSLKLTDKIRFKVEEQICSQDKGTIKNCFDLPIIVIEHFLEQNYFQQFLKSQLFCKYLTELFHKIQENSKKPMENGINTKVNKTRHRKTYSDVTNDKSKTAKFMSSQNTLLAMDTSYHRNKTKAHDIMHIDSRQLYNPDLLWRRDTVPTRLTFGRVDALGRYERDFDSLDSSEDDKWNKNRIKKAMRKLVNLPEDKAQEELAWQVAEMIVKDITNITMSKT